MGIERAQWPATPVPDGVKLIIARFYDLTDAADRSQAISQELARSVFTGDGQYIVNKLIMKGEKDISKFDRGGDSILRLRHDVGKVWALNEAGDDLLLTGVSHMWLKDGSKAETNTAARFVIEGARSGDPKIKLLQGWVDFVPFLDIGFHLPTTEQIHKATGYEQVWKRQAAKGFSA